MAAQYINDALKHPHPDVPFATIGDDTISALATLAEIFTRKFKKVEAPEIPLAPVNAAANKQPESRVQQTLKSPLRHQYQTRFKKSQLGIPQLSTISEGGHTSNKECSTSEGANRARQVPPHNLSQDFLDMGGANCAIAFGENHWTKTPMMNLVVHLVTGKEMQYKDPMKDPELAPLFEIGLRNEAGRICQGIRDIAGTNTIFFVELACTIPGR
jgi:hypothetical protein